MITPKKLLSTSKEELSSKFSSFVTGQEIEKYYRMSASNFEKFFKEWKYGKDGIFCQEIIDLFYFLICNELPEQRIEGGEIIFEETFSDSGDKFLRIMNIMTNPVPKMLNLLHNFIFFHLAIQSKGVLCLGDFKYILGPYIEGTCFEYRKIFGNISDRIPKVYQCVSSIRAGSLSHHALHMHYIFDNVGEREIIENNEKKGNQSISYGCAYRLKIFLKSWKKSIFFNPFDKSLSKKLFCMLESR